MPEGLPHGRASISRAKFHSKRTRNFETQILFKHSILLIWHSVFSFTERQISIGPLQALVTYLKTNVKSLKFITNLYKPARQKQPRGSEETALGGGS